MYSFWGKSHLDKVQGCASSLGWGQKLSSFHALSPSPTKAERSLPIVKWNIEQTLMVSNLMQRDLLQHCKKINLFYLICHQICVKSNKIHLLKYLDAKNVIVVQPLNDRKSSWMSSYILILYLLYLFSLSNIQTCFMGSQLLNPLLYHSAVKLEVKIYAIVKQVFNISASVLTGMFLAQFETFLVPVTV